jgi:hypothetical protein
MVVLTDHAACSIACTCHFAVHRPVSMSAVLWLGCVAGAWLLVLLQRFACRRCWLRPRLTLLRLLYWPAQQGCISVWRW